MNVEKQQNKIVFPEKALYFNEVDINYSMTLDSNEKKIKKILSLKVNIIIGECEIIRKTIVFKDKFGKEIVSCKMSVELILDSNIRYMSVNDEPTLEVKTCRQARNIFIAIPKYMYDENSIDLLRKRRILITPFIEDIYYRVLQDNEINVNIAVFTNAEFLEGEHGI